MTESNNYIGQDLKYDWPKASGEFNPKSGIVGIWGPTNSGKTTLALTSKPPITLFESDLEKVDGIREIAAAKGVDIYPWCFGGFAEGNPKEKADVFLPILEEAEGRLIDACRRGGSIVIDTDNDFWGLYCKAFFGDLKPGAHKCWDKNGSYEKIGPRNHNAANWGLPNGKWHDLFHLIKSQQALGNYVNLVLVSQATDKYVNDEKRGIERKCQKRVPELCHVVFQTSTTMQPDGTYLYHSTIVKPWHNAYVQGKSFSNQTGFNNIPKLMSIVTSKYENGKMIGFGDEEVWK